MLDERFLELMDVLEELKEKARDGWVIVVEGKRDERALRMLGIEGEIIVFSSFREVVDKIRDRKVIILTDYDRRGIEIEKD